MICPYCEEYEVDEIPKGHGLGNTCENCEEYSIPEEEYENESD